MPAQPAYLTLNRHGTYYFRIVTPKPLRSAFGIQREIRRSLKTDSLRLALRRARQYAARFEAAFDRVLAVVDQDDYEPTDEDYELFVEQLNQASQPELWGSYSSNPAEPAPAYKSTFTDEEWREVEEQQRRGDIAKALTGHAKRPIPERQQELAERLYTAGLNLPRPQFQKMLPKLIEGLVLQQFSGRTRVVAAQASTSAEIGSKPNGPTLYELWVQQWETLQRLTKGKKKNERTKEDEQGHACRLNILSGNKPINLLTLDDFERIYLQIFDIRMSRGKKLPAPDSSPESILALEGQKRIGAGTIEKMTVRLSSLHSFAHKKGMTAIDPKSPDKPQPDHSPAGRIPTERAFTQDDLKAIFSGHLYTGTNIGNSKGVFPYQFWLPLLGLYTGGRLNELCQLDTEDISQQSSDRIWSISIMDDPMDRHLPKSLKNQSSRRILPIHNELIRMGFLEFVEHAREEGREKLFSDGLTYSTKKGWGGIATHFFCRFPSLSTKAAGYFYKCGIRVRDSDGDTDGKNFHSFRHTFTDLARAKGLEACLVLPDLTGHSRSKEGTVARYGNGFTLEQKRSVLEGLPIPVDLSGITYADFNMRLGYKLKPCIEQHRKKHGLNQVEQAV